MGEVLPVIGKLIWGRAVCNNSDITLILIIILSGFLSTFSLALVTILLPSISVTYNIGTSLASWVLLFPFLLNMSFGLVVGKIGDKIGFKRIFLWGIFLFTIGSLLCGTSVGIYMLIASRGLQAIGVSMFLTVGIASIYGRLHTDLQGRAMGCLTALESLGAAAGFFFGGLIDHQFGWKWAFLITIPAACAILLIASVVMPKDEKRCENGRLDILGAAIVTVSFFALTFSFNMGKEFGWTSPIIIGCLIIFFFGIAAFIVREKRIAEPIVDISLFKSFRFISDNLVGFFIYLAISGSFFLFPLYFGFVSRMESSKVGLIMTLVQLCIVVTALVAGYLIDRFGAEKTRACGMIIAAASLLLLSYAAKDARPDHIFYLATVTLGTSFSLVFPANAELMLGSCPMGKKGSATSVTGMFLGLSGLFGTVLFETVLTLAPVVNGNRFLEFRELPLADQITGVQSAFMLGFASCVAAIIVAYWAAKKYGRNYDCG